MSVWKRWMGATMTSQSVALTQPWWKLTREIRSNSRCFLGPQHATNIIPSPGDSFMIHDSLILEDHKHWASTGSFCDKTMVPEFWHIDLWTPCLSMYVNLNRLLNLSNCPSIMQNIVGWLMIKLITNYTIYKWFRTLENTVKHCKTIWKGAEKFLLPQVLFLRLSFLVLVALYLEQFGTRICHFA